MEFEDSVAIRRAILILARKIATRVGRRRKPDGKTEEIDLRRTMRRNLKYGGDIIEFQLRRKNLKRHASFCSVTSVARWNAIAAF